MIDRDVPARILTCRGEKEIPGFAAGLRDDLGKPLRPRRAPTVPVAKLEFGKRKSIPQEASFHHIGKMNMVEAPSRVKSLIFSGRNTKGA